MALLLLLAGSMARADVPLFRALGAAQGLPSQRVYALAQDADGCLWVGTADGLARFDGSGFEVFHHDPLDPDSPPGNVVQALHRDGRGRLWAGFEGAGLVEVVDHGRRFRRWLGPDGIDATIDVWAIGSDAGSGVYLGGFGTGLVRVDPDTGARRVWGRAEQLASEHVLALGRGADGRLWVGTHGGLQHLWQDCLAPPEPAVKGAVFSLDADRDGLLVGGRAGAFRITAAGIERLEAVSAGSVLGLAADPEEGLWIARSQGLQWLDRAGRMHAALPVGELVARRSVLDLLRDHEGGLWVASDGGGLLHLPPRWRRFRSWPVGRGGLQGSGPTAVVFDARGDLWVGSDDGRVERIDTASGEPSLIAQAAASWPDTTVTGLLVHGSTLWIGTRRGLVLQPLGGGAARVLAAAADEAEAPPLGPIDQLLADGEGTVWLSSYGGGIERRDREGRLLGRWTEAQGLAGLDSEQLRIGPDGALWVAGADGLQRLVPGRARFETVPATAGERVFGFAFTPDGKLWLARRAGLAWLSLRDGRWQLGASLPDLAGVEVGGLAADAQGRLWAASPRGLWRIDPGRGTLRRFGVRDGLPGQEFPGRPLAESPDRLRLAGALPLAVLQVDTLRFEGPERLPPVRWEPLRLRRGGEVLEWPTGDGLVLRHDDRELDFRLRVASFAEPDAWRYRMRLAPFDPQWVELGAEGRRVFPVLPPGTYRLQAAIAGPEGGWHELAPLALRVEPPWWATPWARALQFLALGAAAWLALLAYRARLRRRAELELAESERRWALAASEQKSRFLADLAHEIRTPMTGLLGMAELLGQAALDAEQRRQLEAIQRAGGLLRRLVDDALDLARIEAGKLELRPRPVALDPLCRQVVALMQPVAAGKGLALRCEADAGLPARVVVDAERLEQILLNLLTNAIKFAGQGEILLRAAAVADATELCFEVVDQGPGITPELRSRLLDRFEQGEGEDTSRRYGGAGLGLAICAELARRMGGRFELDGAAGQGTVARVVLPLVPAATEAGEAAIAPAAQATAGLDLLLVEDDPLAAEALSGLLVALGHRVRHAAHALDALAELERTPAQAVLIDLDLPGIDGLTLAGLLRDRHPQAARIVVSARIGPELEPELRRLGVGAWLRKPVAGEALQRALAEALAAGGGP